MAQGQGSPELLPFRPNHATPVSSSELRDLFSWTDRLPGEEWEKSVSGQLTIHRFSEPSRTNPDRVMERGRCEATLSAPLETVFALVDDPKERAKWDEIAGATLKKYRSRSHDFVSFTFEGLMGLASQDFLFWDAQQSYDKHGVECVPGAPAWSCIVLWQPAAVSWEGLPAHEGCSKSVAFAMSMARDELQPERKTKVVAMARARFQTGMVQYFLPSIIQSVLSSQAEKLSAAINEINANASQRKLVQDKGIRGLQRKIPAKPNKPAQVGSAPNKNVAPDAFLLEGDVPQAPEKKLGQGVLASAPKRSSQRVSSALQPELATVGKTGSAWSAQGGVAAALAAKESKEHQNPSPEMHENRRRGQKGEAQGPGRNRTPEKLQVDQQVELQAEQQTEQQTELRGEQQAEWKAEQQAKLHGQQEIDGEKQDQEKLHISKQIKQAERLEEAASFPLSLGSVEKSKDETSIFLPAMMDTMRDGSTGKSMSLGPREPRERRRLELASGLHDEAAEMKLNVGIGLGERLRLNHATGRAQYPDPEPESPLRLRLAALQSTWLRDAKDDKRNEQSFASLQAEVKSQEAIRDLRGTDGWLLHLLREASSADYLAPPWLTSGENEADELLIGAP
ncbi:unnamed protein product [Effrenium voratum]|nr:unnamed protein product [Effrenium voratum]